MSQTTPQNLIGHVLFLDIVAWSRESINAQARLLSELTDLVRQCPTYQAGQAAGQLHAFPTGDGMCIVFTGDLVQPAACAAELAQLLKGRSGLSVRMGINSGPVRYQTDITGTANLIGDGMNLAKRVMDMGDGGHILLSSQYASWLQQLEEWAPYVRQVGYGVTKHDERLKVYSLASNLFGRTDTPSHVRAASKSFSSTGPLHLVIVYKRNAHPDDEILEAIEDAFTADGHEVFIDRHLKIGVEWAKAIEEKIRAADAVVAILSDSALGSEMLEYEVETAYDERKNRGKPYLLPVRVGSDRIVDGPLGAYVNGLNFSYWEGPRDTEKVIAELRSTLREEPKPVKAEIALEPVGGAVPPDSPFYVERAADTEFVAALQGNESILLVKGPRQMGKTSLIGRGAKLVRDLGWQQIATDFQKLSSGQLASDDGFYRLLAATLARQVKFTYDFSTEWLEVFGANMNMDNFVRALLEHVGGPLVWFMDEADRLFGAPFASDFFGLVRSWHNSRATEPNGPWSDFTVVIAYATEAHLFIRDLNQSPFNVGRHLLLQPFNL
ncbi:MAG TPA: AAA-like domain-containing protein, partial [Fimbriimonas sp.]|nr:AAA-like domain-containing protein [Fimbriimonas sp.]